MRKLKLFFGVIALAFCATLAFGQSSKKSVAIFVKNDSKIAELSQEKKNLENILSSMINNEGFAVVSSDLVLRKMNDYLSDENAKYKNEAQKLAESLKGNKTLDMKLFENASGLRIAEFMGADYVLVVSISNLGMKKANFSGYGISTKNTTYTLRCNYNLYESGMGFGAAGKNVKSQRTVRQSESIDIAYDTDMLAAMFEDCSEQMAAALAQQNKDNAIIAKQDSKAEIYIEVKVTAMRFPRVFNDEGEFTIEESEVPLTLMTINADIDGVNHTLGQGKITLSKGIHYLKISHKDIEPIEKTINVTGEAGQKIVFEAALTDEAKARYKEDMDWMQKTIEKYRQMQRREAEANVALQIKQGKAEAEIAKIRMMTEAEATKIKIMSEAEAAKLRGIAEMYKNSGYRVDQRSNVNQNVNIDQRSDNRSDHRSDNRSDHRSDHRSDVKNDFKSDVKVDHKSDYKIDKLPDTTINNNVIAPDGAILGQ